MFKPLYTVCFNGLSEPFCSLYDIARFGAGLMKEKTSFDVWLDNTLLVSYTYNAYTDKFDVSRHGQ